MLLICGVALVVFGDSTHVLWMLYVVLAGFVLVGVVQKTRDTRPWVSKPRLCIHHRRCALGSLFGLQAVAIGLFAASWRRLDSSLPLIGLVCLGLVLPVSILWSLRLRVIYRGVRRVRGMACTYCGYSMVGLESEHTCPECGSPFESEEARERWRSVAGV